MDASVCWDSDDFYIYSSQCVCVTGNGVWDLPVSAGEVSGWREAAVVESRGSGVCAQTVCSATFTPVSTCAHNHTHMFVFWHGGTFLWLLLFLCRSNDVLYLLTLNPSNVIVSLDKLKIKNQFC